MTVYRVTYDRVWSIEGIEIESSSGQFDVLWPVVVQKLREGYRVVRWEVIHF